MKIGHSYQTNLKFWIADTPKMNVHDGEYRYVKSDETFLVVEVYKTEGDHSRFKIITPERIGWISVTNEVIYGLEATGCYSTPNYGSKWFVKDITPT